MNFLKGLSISGAIGAKNFPKAIAAYEKELEENPADDEARWMLAHCLMWNKNYKQAISVANPLPGHNASDFDVLTLFTRCYCELNDHQTAYVYACRALANPPKPMPPLPKLLTWLPGLKSADRDVEAANSRELGWVRKYKVWCEERLGFTPPRFADESGTKDT